MLALLTIAFVAILTTAFLPGATTGPVLGPVVTHTVSRGDLQVSVTEEGILESSKNTEIKCQIRGGYGGRGGESTVTWVIPSGTIVEEGDELVRLDTKIIEETVSLGKTDTNIAKAELARTQADVVNAQVAIEAYLDGTYRSDMEELRMELTIAQKNVRTSTSMLHNTEKLFQQGFVTDLDVDIRKYTLRRSELELKVKETEIDVLERLTKAMKLEELNGQLYATKERLKGRTAGVELEQGRLDLAREELGLCVIKAPQSGLVIYPSTAKWKQTPDVTEGASVRNNQVLLLMPDLSQMQVKIGIHESLIEQVEPGQETIVRLSDRTLDTNVSSVAAVARPAGCSTTIRPAIWPARCHCPLSARFSPPRRKSRFWRWGFRSYRPKSAPFRCRSIRTSHRRPGFRSRSTPRR